VNEVANYSVRYYLSGTLEIVALMLEYYHHTNNASYLVSSVIPFINEVLIFYDSFYTKIDGKIFLEPAQALYTYLGAVNPAPDIAGLTYILNFIQQLIPEEYISPQNRTFYEKFYKAIPDLPMTIKNGTVVMAPCESYQSENYTENPELYSVYPFHLYGVGLSNASELEILRNTYYGRQWKGIDGEMGNLGWRLDPIHAAYLGIIDEAAYLVRQRFTMSPGLGTSFPSFWGPFYDWIPEEDHGAVARNSLQYMLVQHYSDKIYLLPAWPTYWNAEFKICAPYMTTITGVISNGTVTISVTPQSRMKDIILSGDFVLVELSGPTQMFPIWGAIIVIAGVSCLLLIAGILLLYRYYTKQQRTIKKPTTERNITNEEYSEITEPLLVTTGDSDVLVAQPPAQENHFKDKRSVIEKVIPLYKPATPITQLDEVDEALYTTN